MICGGDDIDTRNLSDDYTLEHIAPIYAPAQVQRLLISLVAHSIKLPMGGDERGEKSPRNIVHDTLHT